MEYQILGKVLILLLAAVVTLLLFRQLRLPPVLGYLVVGVAASWLGFGPGISVVIGGAIALSSTALVIKQLSDQLELSNPHGRLATGILLFQDIAAVPLPETKVREGDVVVLICRC